MAIETKIEGNKLIITCDLEKPTPSASGKNACSSQHKRQYKNILHGRWETINNRAERLYPQIAETFKEVILVAI